MVCLSSTSTSLAAATLVLSSCISAAPFSTGTAMNMQHCAPDPRNEIGGDKYSWMWSGAEPHSWTSGYHRDNARYDALNFGFVLHSGDKSSSTNAYDIRVMNKGTRDYHYGFLVAKNEECFAKIPRSVLKNDTKFKVAVADGD